MSSKPVSSSPVRSRKVGTPGFAPQFLLALESVIASTPQPQVKSLAKITEIELKPIESETEVAQAEKVEVIKDRSDGGRLVDLVVEQHGPGSSITLKVNLKNLVDQSSYFKKLISNRPDPVENAVCCRLRYEEDVLLRFGKWINHPGPPKPYVPRDYSRDFWTDNALPMWLLAHEIGSPNLEKFALSHFIQNCTLFEVGPWETIERRAPWDSSLRRFSDYWVAWNYSLAGSGWNEYAGLRATHLAVGITDETRDPRTLDQIHWYSSCARSLVPSCDHDPIFKKQKSEAAREVNVPQETWGEDIEKRLWL